MINYCIVPTSVRTRVINIAYEELQNDTPKRNNNKLRRSNKDKERNRHRESSKHDNDPDFTTSSSEEEKEYFFSHHKERSDEPRLCMTGNTRTGFALVCDDMAKRARKTVAERESRR